jgi:cell division protease FtsH
MSDSKKEKPPSLIYWLLEKLGLVENNGKKEKYTKKRIHFTIGYIIAAILLMQLLQSAFGKNTSKIPYSLFKKYVARQKVDDLLIGDEYIQGDIKTGEPDGEKNYFITVRVPDSDLVKDLEKNLIGYSGQQESKLLAAVFSWVVPLAIFFIVWRIIFSKMSPGTGVMTFGKSRARIFADDDIKIAFSDVGGVDEARDELMEVVDFLSTPKRYSRLGGRIPRGVMLVGPPGTGKTLLARAVAGEAKVPFFSLSGSEFVEMFVGVGASRVRDLFKQAQKNAPCLVFIDELDAIGKVRMAGAFGGHEEREQTLNQLLVEMDGFEPNSGVIIMAATNRPESLDPALLRPGRFDRHVLVDRPDISGRKAILKIHSKDVKLSPEVDLEVVATRTIGFAGADLANIVNEAALLAARYEKDSVGIEEFSEAIERTTTGLEKKKRVINTNERKIVGYHEAGHALVALVVPNSDPVHKVSVIPRGIAALGYTIQVPTEDRYLMTRSELLDKLAILLGGRVAEEVVFGEISTGAQNDLQKATDIATSMVKEYGMSEKMGNVTFEKNRRPLFMDAMTPSSREYSDETARLIDREIGIILNQATERVRKILTERKSYLERLTEHLLEKEVLEKKDIKEITQGIPLENPPDAEHRPDISESVD